MDRRKRSRTHSTQPQAATRPPPLLSVPGEIRNEIYEYLVVLTTPVCIFREKQKAGGSDADREPAPLASVLVPLFLTCRRLHLEASAVFYSRNSFALPAIASQAPYQIQTNLLFRFFLDRIGPRNAALLRHLAVPFPAFDGPGAAAGPATASASLLIQALSARCPNLETLELDLRWDSSRWLRLLRPHTATVRALLAPLHDALRAAFPALSRVRVRLAGGERAWSFLAWQDATQAEVVRISAAGWEWVRGALEGGVGWEVVLDDDDDKEEEEEEEAGEGQRATAGGGGGEEGHDGAAGDGSGWTALWHPPSPRHAVWLLYAPPAMVVRSEIHDQWTLLEVIKFRLYYARAWLRSPNQAAQDRNEADEWREWRRTMIAKAGPIRVPLAFALQGV
ncbi:278e274c-2095-4b96-9ddb-e1b627742427 [Thermothielavioides terrestris]|uniref:278e274c-2095-4b96-9ddb-e1b627742427 n=1 Tax=Thermothielavioides terrestris TaxID=2587410 RepID=A0A3S4BAF5_9PEZI|nr:278e274c-2095-4b96-9ddb-e1b627742427 [Thermothielavioides terrestris]